MEKTRILMVDNFDSFTFNLVQYFEELGAEVVTFRNNNITAEEIENMGIDGLVISPGPGRPENAGGSMDFIRCFSGKKPILGVCLGHQSIARVFHADVVHAKRLMHGKVSEITADGKGVFAGVTRPFKAMRYHSLAVREESLPFCLEITARAEDGEIMGLRHREHPTEGIQFHPESIMTPMGKRFLRNFLDQAAGHVSGQI
ncbi:anthranilate synthase component II [Desulfobotulus alkaliphilus]|uniref:Anthranilate synthase component II n=1 Tax=Desulfobotulus alkaliphilus TaxID=622671 RepID=A0A562RS75_9BACT|nr:aminodeoxychorismate/anthranilate synthase component II [Desulfobotulus alkaliphilus]TWI71156.1 anthranilate synthase component II [Desulfobotulus alkaliphilus]